MAGVGEGLVDLGHGDAAVHKQLDSVVGARDNLSLERDGVELGRRADGLLDLGPELRSGHAGRLSRTSAAIAATSSVISFSAP